jgi:hypothetical protein
MSVREGSWVGNVIIDLSRGERVQMDTCKIVSGRYQYTEIDDCTQYQTASLFTERISKNTLCLLNKVIE